MIFFNAKKITYYLFFLLLISTSSFAGIKDCGQKGKTYPIKERDALEEIESMASSMPNASLPLSKEQAEKAIKNYKPKNINKIPKSQANKIRFYRPEYITEFDIPDEKGNILYPKGYKFYPLDYMYNPKTYIIIDATDSTQIEWFKKSEYFNKNDAVLLITDGPYYELTELTKKQVYYCPSQIQKGFDLQGVPSVVKQESTQLKITEIKID